MSNISSNYCSQCRHEYVHCKCHLQPPTDAAVREAIKYAEVCLSDQSGCTALGNHHLRILLTYVRAAFPELGEGK